MSAVWKVSFKQGYYLVLARSPEAGRRLAERYARSSDVVAVERYVPAGWPPMAQWAEATRRREAARERAVARKPRPATRDARRAS